MQVYAGSGSGEYTVGNTDCSTENVEPLPIWVSQLPLTKIVVTWNSKVTLPTQMPAASYINSGRPVVIGVVDADAVVSFANNRKCIYCDCC